MNGSAADDEVTIVVVRTGGFAGLRRSWRVDAATDDAVHWRALIAECPWDDERCEADDGADRFVWSIRAHAADAVRERTLPEAALTGPWRALVDAVREADRTAPDAMPDGDGA